MAEGERVEFTPSGREVVHGSASSYNNHKCRCPECKAAWAKYVHDRGYVKRFRERERAIEEARRKADRGTKIKL